MRFFRMSRTSGGDRSSSVSLASIRQDLSSIEDGLSSSVDGGGGGNGRTSRRSRRTMSGGRAIYSSVTSMLSSLRSRIEQHHANNRDAEILLERVRTAQRAHSNRVPLNILQTQSPSSSSSTDRRTSWLVEHQQQRRRNSRNTKPSSSSSSLVASRRKLHEMETENLHASSVALMLSPVHESGHDSVEMVWKEASSTHDDDDNETGLMPPTVPSIQDDDNDESIIAIMSDSNKRPKEAKDVCAVYSWGKVTLHDDNANNNNTTVPAYYDKPTLVSREDRIGRLGTLQWIDCGPNHIACVTAGGEVYAAGTNTSGQVLPFERDTTMITRPRLVEAIGNQTQIRQVSCGLDHTAALVANSGGSVLTWGSNIQGQLGHWKSSRTSFVAPKTMTLGPSIQATSVACGNQFTLVLTTRLSVLTCGVKLGSTSSANDDDDATDDTPHELPYLAGLPIGSIAASGNHAVVVTVPGVAYAWGNNTDQSCGRVFPELVSIPMPMETPGEGDVQTVLGPIHHVPKLVVQRAMDGTNKGMTQTTSLSQDVAVAHVSCGTSHTIRVTRNGRLLVSGSNSYGQLGIPTTVTTESRHLEVVNHPLVGKKFVRAACGDTSTLLMDEDGTVWQTMPEGMMQIGGGGGGWDAIAAGGSQFIVASGCLPMMMVPPNNDMRTIGTEIARLVKKVSEEEEGNNNNKKNNKNDGATTTTITALGQKLVNLLGDMLRYPSVLNNLFFVLSDLDKLYSDLRSSTTGRSSELQQALATTAERSILAGLDYLQSSNATLKHPGSVRFLLHYIRFFDHDEKADEQQGIVFDPSGRAIASLCEALLSLSFEGFKHVLAWISLYPPKLFVSMLLKPMMSQLNKALTVDIDGDGVVHYKLARRAAPQIGTVLRWFHVAAEQDESLATPEDFYCRAISEMPLQDLFEDLMAMKTAAGEGKNSSTSSRKIHGFLLSESPFLIPPTTKRDLLSIENEINMLRTAAQTSTIVTTTTDEEEDNNSSSTITFDPFFVIEVERENLLEEALTAIKEAEPSQLRKKLRVKFKDEAGVDAGGVAKEFFQLLSEELFDINSPLWTRRYGDHVTWFNSDCTWDDEGFEYAGVLFALALYNSVLLDVHFPEALYRKLLDKSLGLEDLVDEEIKRGLQQLLDYDGNDVEDVFCLTFEVTWRSLGTEHKVELKPGGANMEVTKDNKEEYVVLYVKWLLVDSIEPQWEAFRRGVDRTLEGSSLRNLFTPTEMELLVVGSPELDFAALEENTKYEGWYDPKKSDVIRNLWRFVKNADRETQKQFLKFTTGSTMAPIGGLGAMQFKVQRAGPDSTQLPTSHTCFNTLLLPDYGNNYEKLSERLGRAVLECEGFGLE